MQSEQFTDGIGARTRNHYISQGKQIFQFGFNIFKLNISFQGLERIVYLAFSTEVDHMKIFEKIRQISRTALLTTTEPRLPPMIRMTGFSAERPQNFNAASAFPVRSSCRIGEPVKTAFSFGRCSNVSGSYSRFLWRQESKFYLQSRGHIRFMNDRWDFTFFPAITTGTVTKPPLEKNDIWL